MSVTYKDLVFSQFPDEIDAFQYFSDPTIDDVALIKQYQSYFNSGNISSAAKILEDNPRLQNKIINANNLNKIIDAIKAIQLLYRDDIQTYIMELVTYRGVYSSKISYSKYDIVLYNEFAYMCISSNYPMGVLPTDTNYFIKLTLKGDKGESGTGLTPMGIWDANTQYYLNDLVAYNNVLWASNTSNINSKPSDESSVWYAVLSLNIVLEELKISNSEIDDIINGNAEQKDDETGTI